MNRYVFAPAADDDLVEIYLYTFERWSRDQADMYTARIRATCDGIAVGSVRCKPIPEFGGKYFKASVGSHFIVCRRDADRLIIVRILHQRMDIVSHLED